jgi:hypothetical protein
MVVAVEKCTIQIVILTSRWMQKNQACPIRELTKRRGNHTMARATEAQMNQRA